MTALVPKRGPKIPGVSRDRDQIGQHISDKQVRREYDQVEADKKKIVGGQDFVQLAH